MIRSRYVFHSTLFLRFISATGLPKVLVRIASAEMRAKINGFPILLRLTGFDHTCLIWKLHDWQHVESNLGLTCFWLSYWSDFREHDLDLSFHTTLVFWSKKETVNQRTTLLICFKKQSWLWFFIALRTDFVQHTYPVWRAMWLMINILTRLFSFQP